MMSRLDCASLVRFAQQIWQINRLIALTGISLLLLGKPAFAHHAMGGRFPSNAFEGFMSGLAHPIIGFDHFAFVVAIGLLFATQRQGFLIPLAFVLAAMGGTGIHLMGVTLPGVELLIAGSVLLFGLLLVQKDRVNIAVVVGLAAIAGVCHGYAYGESIVGAEVTPLVAYLTGFTAIQLAIAMGAFGVGRAILSGTFQSLSVTTLRSTGWLICGIGLAFLASQITSALSPVT
ncbi:MAG: HupE/UreJ family protein [Oculatellaceae cyanobacterium bins.114]|nr:HupE/UreJ family protein [Oculatellaceae cyanobacterium bins.114]